MDRALFLTIGPFVCGPGSVCVDRVSLSVDRTLEDATMSFSQFSSPAMTDSDSQDIEMPESDTIEHSPPVYELSSPDEATQTSGNPSDPSDPSEEGFLDLSDPELLDPELEDPELAVDVNDVNSEPSTHSDISDTELWDSELLDLEMTEDDTDSDLRSPETPPPSCPNLGTPSPRPAPYSTEV